jgi:hypothetical protein
MSTLKYGIAIAGGLIVAGLINEPAWVFAMGSKAIGRNYSCPWSKLIAVPWSAHRFVQLQKEAGKSLSVIQTDDKLAIELIRTPTRPFWIKKAGDEMDGRGLLGYVLAEQQWIAESAKEFGVRPGDVVVDVGAQHWDLRG